MFKRLRRTRLSENLRNLVREHSVSVADFIYPLFVVEGNGIRREVRSLPGVFQMSIDEVLKEIEDLSKLGIYHIILFGIPEYKDACGSEALSDQGIIAKALRTIKKSAPQMFVSVDLCFCEYTDHGHCGILDTNGIVDNDATLEILVQQAIVLCASGADMIAPSGMMDGCVGALRAGLDKAGFSHIPIMAYSTKFASAYYGPFRDVAQSAPSFGDRKTYQHGVSPAYLSCKKARRRESHHCRRLSENERDYGFVLPESQNVLSVRHEVGSKSVVRHIKTENNGKNAESRKRRPVAERPLFLSAGTFRLFGPREPSLLFSARDVLVTERGVDTRKVQERILRKSLYVESVVF